MNLLHRSLFSIALFPNICLLKRDPQIAILTPAFETDLSAGHEACLGQCPLHRQIPGMGVDPYGIKTCLGRQFKPIGEHLPGHALSLASFRHTDPVEGSVRPISKPCPTDLIIRWVWCVLKGEDPLDLSFFYRQISAAIFGVLDPDLPGGIAFLPLIQPQSPELTLGVLCDLTHA